MSVNVRAVSLLGRGAIAMVEYRKHPRHRTLKGGKIIYNRRLTVIDCVIRNLSPGGACLEVNTHYLPDEFQLTIPPCSVHKQPLSAACENARGARGAKKEPRRGAGPGVLAEFSNAPLT